MIQNKTLLIVVGLVVIGALAYYFYQNKDKKQGQFTLDYIYGDTAGQQQAQTQGQKQTEQDQKKEFKIDPKIVVGIMAVVVIAYIFLKRK